MTDSGFEMMVWNMVLTLLVALLGFVAKSKFNEMDRVAILLNKTREEVARDHITRAEYSRDLEKLMERFDAGVLRLEVKIDELNKQVKRSA
jgi:uncharacterized membrane protein